jgi:hypothetical protein
MIATAAMFVQIGRWARGLAPAARSVWTVAAALMLMHLGYTVWREYPWYHLAGYHLIGDRWLGAESRGYRNVIQTPSDGVESLIRWCVDSQEIRPGAKVVSFLWEDMPGHIVDGVLPENPRFSLIRRGLTRDSDIMPPPPTGTTPTSSCCTSTTSWATATAALTHLISTRWSARSRSPTRFGGTISPWAGSIAVARNTRPCETRQVMHPEKPCLAWLFWHPHSKDP